MSALQIWYTYPSLGDGGRGARCHEFRVWGAVPMGRAKRIASATLWSLEPQCTSVSVKLLWLLWGLCPVQSAWCPWSFVSIFFPVHFPLSGPRKGRLLKASKIRYPEKLSAWGGVRSGPRKGLSRWNAGEACKILVSFLCRVEIYGAKSGLVLVLPGYLVNWGRQDRWKSASHLIHCPWLQFKLVLTSHSESLRLNTHQLKY